MIRLAVLALLFSVSPVWAGDAAKGVTCSEFASGVNVCNKNGCFVCTAGAWVEQPMYFGASSATCDSAHEGLQRYNSTSKGMEFCNGAAWTPYVNQQSTPAITAPSGSGYFVMTHTTYNGNLGGLAGADAKCLTELGTTYTSWRGYTDANGRGLITAAKVRALICDYATCNNLMPLTTYYFAYANSGTPGGASFTTDSSGRGPSDSNPWSAANYFSGSYTWWSDRASVSATVWQNYGYAGYDCNNGSGGWGADSIYSGNVGNTTAVDDDRWIATTSTCDIPQRLVCFVNP